MYDRIESRKEIVYYLCGEDGLSPKFLNLLESAGMGEYEGLQIKNEMLELAEGSYDLNLEFSSKFRQRFEMAHGLVGDEIQKDEVRDTIGKYYIPKNCPPIEYDADKDYKQLLFKQYPQSINQAVYEAIRMMDRDAIDAAKDSDKSSFISSNHFGLGLHIKNNFGLQHTNSSSLICEILEKKGTEFFFNEDVSAFLLGEVWEEIQANHDKIIAMKLYKCKKYVWELVLECEELFESKKYGDVLDKCEEIFKWDLHNEKAAIFKAMALHGLNESHQALDAICEAVKKNSDSYTLVNVKSIILSELDMLEEALDCLDEFIMKHPNCIFIINKKLSLLIRMNRIGEAYELYKGFDDDVILNGFKIQLMASCLAKNKKCDEAIECYNRILKSKLKDYSEFDYDSNDFCLFDEIKRDFIELGLDLNEIYPNELYLSWIDNLTYATDECPICGDGLIPRYFEYCVFPSKEDGSESMILDEHDPFNRKIMGYCRNCDKKFDMGIGGLHADCSGNYMQEKYALDKILLLKNSFDDEKVSLDKLKEEFYYFDELELNSFINKLKKINYIHETETGVFKY